VEEGRQGLWGKTKKGFKYVYDHHFNDFDWFMKADDDTFVIIENLKSLLVDYDTNSPNTKRRVVPKVCQKLS